MEKREDRNTKAMNKPVPPYARLYFDHLYSEYIALKPSIKVAGLTDLLDELHQRRRQHDLTWSDIYTFDLTLVDVRPPESLVRKAYDSRARYRSVAGQKEYDEYIASKPLDLGTIQVDPDADPPEPKVIVERELRADIKYLLSKFYLYYALMPVREGLRDELTKKAVLATAVAVVLIVLAIALNVGAASQITWLNWLDQYSSVLVTLLTVTLAGIIGGCVSMLQRIQAAPTEGDALFNLAALTNGWRGILLSPIYGAIFASLLFVLFAGGILNGSVFPTIVTPSRSGISQPPTPSPTPAPNLPRGALPSSGSLPLATESPKTQSRTSASPAATPVALSETPKPESTASPSPSPSPVATPRAGVLQIKEFLIGTGPASGVAYALLIIWSFLAGFAERLVPDTLNRLVQKNLDISGGGGS